MLDATIQVQLHSVFRTLQNPITLRVVHSTHSNVAELAEMVNDLASTSDKIRVAWVNVATAGPVLEMSRAHEKIRVAWGSTDTAAPSLEVVRADGKVAASFRGVPGGREFTSLVLAILHSDGKGKQPDEGIVRRIQAIRGPIRLKTYVSLTCENCPDVVQALNLMATHHPDFRHETIDGAVAQEEIEQLGIQGVPAVIHDGQLLHSGQSTLADLLTMLEKTFETSAQTPQDLGTFDVVVIGGGPAGTSSAVYSVRKGLKTALIAEHFGGQLQQTKGIENMISVPYTEGVRLSAQLGEHMQRYPVQIFEHRRVRQITDAATKRIDLDSREFLHANTVIIATGAQWRRLNIPGETQYIGNGVAFCAHCDGPFYKGKDVAVVGGGNSGVEAAIDLANIARHVTLLEFNDRLKADDVLVDKLRALRNVAVATGAKCTEVLGDGKKVTALRYNALADNTTHDVPVEGVFVQIGLSPNSQFVKGLVEMTACGEITTDAKGRTSVPGIYAAGDVTTVPFKQIIIAMGEGAKVALTAFEDRMHA